MSVGAKRKHGRAVVAGGRHERVALCLKAAADRYHSRDKAMPGEMAGDVGAWLRSVTLHRWFRVENEDRSEEHTSELQSLMRISYAVFCLQKKISQIVHTIHYIISYTSIKKQYNITA